MRAIATSGNAVEVVEALAGTGKTTVAGRAGRGLSAGGLPGGRGGTDRAGGARAVEPRRGAGQHASPTGRGPAPQRGVRIGTGGAAGRRGRHGADPGQRRACSPPPTRGVKVVALGDSGQLSSVEAGGWLGALSQRLGAHELRGGGAPARSGRAPRAGRAARRRPDRVARAQAATWRVGGSPRRPAGGPGGGHGRLAGRRGRGGNRAGGHDRPATTTPAPRLNDEARAWRESRGELGERIEVGGLEVAVGDRVIARRNDREIDVDNGTRGTVRAVDLETHAVTIETDAGELRELPARLRRRAPRARLRADRPRQPGRDGRAGGGRRAPEDFTNEWAYTALSRARDPVSVHLIAERTRPVRPQRDRARPTRTDPARRRSTRCAPRCAAASARSSPSTKRASCDARRCRRSGRRGDRACAAGAARARPRRRRVRSSSPVPEVLEGRARTRAAVARRAHGSESTQLEQGGHRPRAPPLGDRPARRARGTGRPARHAARRRSRTTKSRPPAAQSSSPPARRAARGPRAHRPAARPARPVRDRSRGMFGRPERDLAERALANWTESRRGPRRASRGTSSARSTSTTTSAGNGLTTMATS